MALEDKVKEIVVEQLGVNPDQVKPEASFIDDLGADSLDTVELVMAFEEEFGAEIPDEEAEKLTTVGAVLDYLKDKGGRALKEKHKIVVRHFTNLENSCLPGGQLQERTFNIFPYLIKYGPGFIEELRRAIPLEEDHYIHRW